jgi:SAM-dependent methyltransferase
MRKFIKKIAAPLKPWLEWLVQKEANVAKYWAAQAHKRLFRIQWTLPPQTEFFDHHIDLFQQWLTTRNSLWVERGVFGSIAQKIGGDILELACGDGFMARNFYSLRARKIVACDFDPLAIRLAKRKNSAPNIEYVVSDIRTQMPEGKFDTIVWDAAIEHFTPEETRSILYNIKQRLNQDGILCGYTLLGKEEAKAFSHHEYEFKSKEELLRCLTPYFKYVSVFETIYLERTNFYFWASDSNQLPFRKEWPHLAMQ